MNWRRTEQEENDSRQRGEDRGAHVFEFMASPRLSRCPHCLSVEF